MIVLDTDVLIEVFDKHSDKGNRILKELTERGDSICTTAINLHEVMYGLQKYAKQIAVLQELPVIDYTKEDAHTSVRLELAAEKVGSPVRRTDAMIAAIAITNEAHLFTLDQKHYTTMEPSGLKLLHLDEFRQA